MKMKFTKAWPKSKERKREMKKEMFPCGVNVDKDVVERAKKILENIANQGSEKGTHQAMIGRYFDHRVFLEKPAKKAPYIRRGAPASAVIAFSDLDGRIRIGWARRYENKEAKNYEPPRREITATAVLRGLTDDFTIVSENLVVNANGKPVPKTIANQINHMIPRISKYFKREAVNIKFK